MLAKPSLYPHFMPRRHLIRRLMSDPDGYTPSGALRSSNPYLGSVSGLVERGWDAQRTQLCVGSILAVL